MPKNPVSPKSFRFTEASVKAASLPTATRLIRYQDSALPGLRLRVMQSGARTFLVYRKVNGKPVDLKLGCWPELTVEKARKMAQEALGKIAAGLDPNAEKRTHRAETTLGELFADYLRLHAMPRKRTWETDQDHFDRYLSKWKNRQLSSIENAHVQDWHAKIGRERGPVAANRAHSLLRKMFNFSRGRGWKGGNPAVGVQRFPERSRERFLDAIELKMFFAALDAEPDRTARDFFLLALLTGARRSNVLAMAWADLDLVRGLWRIPGEISKNGAPMVVILVPQAVTLLNDRRGTDRSPWVLPSAISDSGHFVEPKNAWARILYRAELSRLVEMISERQGLTVDQIIAEHKSAFDALDRLRLEAYSRRLPKGADPQSIVRDQYRSKAISLGLDPDQARMNDLHIHDLRRTLGSWQAAGGGSLSIIGRSLGHKQTQTTAIYARLSLDPVRASVEKAVTAMLATTITASAATPTETHTTHETPSVSLPKLDGG